MLTRLLSQYTSTEWTGERWLANSEHHHQRAFYLFQATEIKERTTSHKRISFHKHGVKYVLRPLYLRYDCSTTALQASFVPTSDYHIKKYTKVDIFS